MKKNILSLIILAFFLSGCFSIYITPFEARPRPASEQVIEKATGWFVKDKIALLDIEGPIGFGGCKPQSVCVVGMLDIVDKIKKDPDIKAIIINVNSNGGEITVTDIIYQALKKLKEEKKVPVYAFVERGAYSGGYYIAMSADEIYSLPTSFVGSIGVIWVSFEIKSTLDKIGIEPVVIKSVEKKDIGSPFRDMTPEERKLIQTEIDVLHTRFASIVKERRPKINKDKISEIANGLHFGASDALKIGLIDGILYYDEFMNMVKNKIGVTDINIVRYSLFNQPINSYYSPGLSSFGLTSENLQNELTNMFNKIFYNTSGFYYLGW